MPIEETNYTLFAKNIYDETKQVRYMMERTWDMSKPTIAIIMYNPARLDPHPYTLGRTLSAVVAAVMKSHQKDFGSIRVVNLIPHLSISKNALPRNLKSFDTLNFDYVKQAVTEAQLVVLFWGNKGKLISRHPQFWSLMQQNFDKLRCFGITRDNEPLYIYSLREDSSLYRVRLTTSGYTLDE